MGYRIQNRRDTAERWAEVNPILLEGEIGYVTDNPNQHKIGDGVHRWNDLPLRGYTGTIAQELGNDENAVVSQKAVTEKVAELNSEIDEFKDSITNQVNNYKPIVVNGNVTNAADEEDITSASNLLKLKDRNNLNGMGHVILRRDKTFAEQLTQTNTIYEIRYDFDLGGAEVTIPEGCVLDFQGGSFSNGKIIGNKTYFQANNQIIFKNIILTGIWENNTWYPEWFGAKGDGITDDTSVFDRFTTSLYRYSNITIIMKGDYVLSNFIRFNLFNSRIKISGIFKVANGAKTPYGLIGILGSYNVIDGLYIDGNESNVVDEKEFGSSALFVVGANANNILIKNANFVNSKYTAIVFDGKCHNITFDNISLDNIGEHCWYISGGSNSNVLFNNVTVGNIGIYQKRGQQAAQNHNGYVVKSRGDQFGANSNFRIENLNIKTTEQGLNVDSIVDAADLTDIVLNNIVTNNVNKIRVINLTSVIDKFTATITNCVANDFSYGAPRQTVHIEIYNSTFNDCYPVNLLSVCKAVNTAFNLVRGSSIQLNDSFSDENYLHYELCKFTYLSTNSMFVINNDIQRDIAFKSCNFYASEYRTDLFYLSNNDYSNRILFDDCKCNENIGFMLVCGAEAKANLLFIDCNSSFRLTNRTLDKLRIVNRIKNVGSTSERPAINEVSYGFCFVDTTINKPIWMIGEKWVDATGADV